MALLLKRRGIERVRPLLGGLDAWIASGRTVEPIASTAAGERAASESEPESAAVGADRSEDGA